MAAVRRYGVYDSFAWFYSRGWGDEYHAQFRPVLDNHIAPRLRAGSRVLDLCCGTGDLSAALAELGYIVTGVDGSEEMLRYAAERAPAARFILEDARTFRSEPVFDAVLSTFDSLNHILEPCDLECVFRNVRAALVPGGFFCFDLNMRECFETLWRGSYASVEDDRVGVTRGSYEPVERLGRADVTLFRREGELWRRSDVAVLERCYGEDEVTEMLRGAGFPEVDVADAYELGMRSEIAIGRSFFTAARPE